MRRGAKSRSATKANDVAKFGLVTSLAALSPFAQSQEVLWQVVGRPDDSALREITVVLGDIDQDGIPDIGNLGLSGQANQHTQTPTAIRIISGRTGAVLRTRLPSPTHYHYIRLVPAGDWNNDGVKDYAATRYAFAWPYDLTYVDVLSGRDDTVLVQLTTGGRYSVDDTGANILSDIDTDGDSAPNLLVSASREVPYGGIYVFAANGTIRYRVQLSGPGAINTRLGAIGDVDQDGCDDFAYWDYDSRFPGGAVRVATGRTGATLYTVGGDVTGDLLGSGRIVGCGDVDTDGVPDFAASSSGAYPINGIVRVFSGRSGRTLYTFRKAFGQLGSAFNWGDSMAGGTDLDQDGIPDLIVGGCTYFCDTMRQVGQPMFIYLLRTGQEIQVCPPDLTQSNRSLTYFGFHVATDNAHPGNPFPVFAVGEHRYGVFSTTYEQGRVHLFRLPPSSVRPYGDRCFGTLTRAPRIGVLNLGPRGVRVHVSDSPLGALAVLLVGSSNRVWNGALLPIKLEQLGFPHCELQTSVLLTMPVVTGTQGTASGYGALDIPLPLASSMGRGTLHAQWLVLGQGAQAPGGLSAPVSWRY